jgi:hypothetical protein
LTARDEPQHAACEVAELAAFVASDRRLRFGPLRLFVFALAHSRKFAAASHALERGRADRGFRQRLLEHAWVAPDRTSRTEGSVTLRTRRLPIEPMT